MTEYTKSLYSLWNKSEDIMGAHIVEFFSGYRVNQRVWDVGGSQTSGTATIGLDDSINGGVKLATGTTSGSTAVLDQTGNCHYGRTSSIIFVSIHSHGADGESYSGLSNGTSGGAASPQITSYVNTGWRSSNFDLYTYGGGAGTWTSGTISGLTSKHAHKLEAKESVANSYVDGVLNCSSTTTLPDDHMKPQFTINNNSATNKTLNITYCEAWET